MVAESYDYEEIEKTMIYYGTRFAKEADFPFNFYLLDLPDGLSGLRAKELVEHWMSNMPEGKWPNWVVSCLLCFFKPCLLGCCTVEL